MLLQRLVKQRDLHLVSDLLTRLIQYAFGACKYNKNKYFMKQFKARVKASGMYVETIVFANSIVEAQKILQAQFGVSNVISIPTQMH